MIGIIAVGTAVRDVFAKRTAQARAPPTVEIVLLRYILRAQPLIVHAYPSALQGLINYFVDQKTFKRFLFNVAGKRSLFSSTISSREHQLHKFVLNFHVTLSSP